MLSSLYILRYFLTMSNIYFGGLPRRRRSCVIERSLISQEGTVRGTKNGKSKTYHRIQSISSIKQNVKLII